MGASLKQIAAENDKIHALITVSEETARRQAREADEVLARGEQWGPLHGIPFTVKDCIETAGLRTTCGYRKLADYIPAQDATVVARTKAAGAILLGKTNLAVLASDLQTQSDFGPRCCPRSVRLRQVVPSFAELCGAIG
jgi:amidase